MFIIGLFLIDEQKIVLQHEQRQLNHETDKYGLAHIIVSYVSRDQVFCLSGLFIESDISN